MTKPIKLYLKRIQQIRGYQRGDQLPLWPEEVRCAPNEFLRSALFNARNRNQMRRYLRQETLALIGKGRITYTGEELRQDDATVWLQLIQMASDTTLGAVVEFTPYSFCQAVGWTPSGETYAHLRKCLTRLQATALTFYAERTGSASNSKAFCRIKGLESGAEPLYYPALRQDTATLTNSVLTKFSPLKQPGCWRLACL